MQEVPNSQEAVFVILCALLDPGDEILLADPYYNSYATMLAYLQGVLVPVPTSPQDGDAFIKAEYEKWKKVIADGNIKEN